MSMPATAAQVERCNKAYSQQKTKSRIRLGPDRAAKLAMVSYNLTIQEGIAAQSKRTEARRNRLHIMALPVTFSPMLPMMPPSELEDSEDDDTIVEDDDLENLEESADDTSSSEEETMSDSDDLTSLNVEIMAGDWVAVFVQQGNGKQKKQNPPLHAPSTGHRNC